MKKEQIKKQSTGVYGLNKLRQVISNEIIVMVQRYEEIKYTVLKLSLVQRFGITDRLLMEMLSMYEEAGILKHYESEGIIKLVNKDVLRQESKPESEVDRARADNGDTQSEERQV